MKALIALVIVAIMAIAGGIYYYKHWDRVEPGNVGILVNTANGQLTPVTETKWQWIGRYEKLVEWNGGQQSYVMEKGDSTGQIKGDDSIECITGDSQRMRFDTQVDWRIDPAQVVLTYQRRRETPLTGPKNREAPGAYIGDLVIRKAIRDAYTKTCPEYGWSDLLGVKQAEFQNRLETYVKEEGAGEGVIVQGLTVLRPYPNDALQALLNARLQGQQQEEQARFAAAEATRQQKIQQDAAVAAQEKARIEAEGAARVRIAQAEAEATAARAKSQAEADAIRAKGQAEAESLRAQASALNPALVELERWRKWDGKLPVWNGVGGDGTQIINQTPAPAR